MRRVPFLMPRSIAAREACDPGAASLHEKIEAQPRAFLRNPALCVTLLGDPGFFARISSGAQIALLSLPELPAHLLEAIARARPLWDGPYVLALAHPHASFAFLRSIFDGRSLSNADLARYRVLQLISKDDPRRLHRWLSGEARGCPTSRRVAAAHVETPRAALSALASDRDAQVRKVMATNPAAPLDLHLQMAARDDLAVQMAMASALETRFEVFALLARCERVVVRALIAHNMSAPPGVLASLADDPSPLVRRAIAAHPLAG